MSQIKIACSPQIFNALAGATVRALPAQQAALLPYEPMLLEDLPSAATNRQCWPVAELVANYFVKGKEVFHQGYVKNNSIPCND